MPCHVTRHSGHLDIAANTTTFQNQFFEKGKNIRLSFSVSFLVRRRDIRRRRPGCQEAVRRRAPRRVLRRDRQCNRRGRVPRDRRRGPGRCRHGHCRRRCRGPWDGRRPSDYPENRITIAIYYLDFLAIQRQ